MSSEWPEVKLGDVADLLTGYPFKSQHYTDDRSAPRLIGGDNIVQGSLRWENVRRWPRTLTAGLDDYWLQQGDVVLAMDRPWIEAGLKRAAISKDDLPSLLIQRTARLRGTKDLETDFLRYVISSSAFTQYVLSVQTGTAVPHISPTQIRAYSFQLPPIEEQHAIASILGALDDKIELNRRMNGTLEALAQAVFKEWFVEKAEKRWETMKVEDALTITKGVSYKSAELADSEVALVTLKSINRGGGYRTDGLKPYVGKYKPAQVITPGELVVAQTDVTQGAEVIGKPALVLIDERQKTLVASLDLLILRPKLAHLDQHFFYLLFRTEDFQNHIYGYTSGTTVLHLSKQGLPSYEFKAPPPALGKRFAEYVKPLFDRIASNAAETRTLTALRDTLLPKLMRGEVRVGLNYTS